MSMARTWIRNMASERRVEVLNPRSPRDRAHAPDHIIKGKAGGWFRKSVARRRVRSRLARLSRRRNREA